MTMALEGPMGLLWNSWMTGTGGVFDLPLGCGLALSLAIRTESRIVERRIDGCRFPRAMSSDSVGSSGGRGGDERPGARRGEWARKERAVSHE